MLTFLASILFISFLVATSTSRVIDLTIVATCLTFAILAVSRAHQRRAIRSRLDAKRKPETFESAFGPRDHLKLLVDVGGSDLDKFIMSGRFEDKSRHGDLHPHCEGNFDTCRIRRYLTRLSDGTDPAASPVGGVVLDQSFEGPKVDTVFGTERRGWTVFIGIVMTAPTDGETHTILTMPDNGGVDTVVDVTTRQVRVNGKRAAKLQDVGAGVPMLIRVTMSAERQHTDKDPGDKPSHGFVSVWMAETQVVKDVRVPYLGPSNRTMRIGPSADASMFLLAIYDTNDLPILEIKEVGVYAEQLTRIGAKHMESLLNDLRDVRSHKFDAAKQCPLSREACRACRGSVTDWSSLETVLRQADQTCMEAMVADKKRDNQKP